MEAGLGVFIEFNLMPLTEPCEKRMIWTSAAISRALLFKI